MLIVLIQDHGIQINTGKYLSEALTFASTKPQNDNSLFIVLWVQYMKIPSSEHVYTTCSELVIRISASEKDLPVPITNWFFAGWFLRILKWYMWFRFSTLDIKSRQYQRLPEIKGKNPLERAIIFLWHYKNQKTKNCCHEMAPEIYLKSSLKQLSTSHHKRPGLLVIFLYIKFRFSKRATQI